MQQSGSPAQQPKPENIERQVKKVLQLNDDLALMRTLLANERTYLSYIRTALTLLVAGFTLIRFFENQGYVWAGIMLLPLSVLVMVIGTVRYRRRNTELHHKEQHMLNL